LGKLSRSSMDCPCLVLRMARVRSVKLVVPSEV
jgi:hypothetical protein